MASVMPVSTVISGGIATPGLTNVCSVPRHSPARSLTAPTSVMAPSSADPPVVSTSTMQNVVSLSGTPRSSNDRCTPTERRRTGVRSQPLHQNVELEPEARRHQAQWRCAQVQQLLVEARQREVGAPCGPGPLAQAEDLELAPGVAAVGGVEGRPRRLAA